MIVQTTKAEQDNAVAVTLAEQKLKVTQTQLEAAKDKASAIVAKAQADADVIRFNNKAELAGLAARVAAFDGDGAALAQNILVGKLAPGFRSILTNSDGPLMDLFGQFVKPAGRKASRPRPTPRPPTAADGRRPSCPHPRSLPRRPSRERLDLDPARQARGRRSLACPPSATSASGSG